MGNLTPAYSYRTTTLADMIAAKLKRSEIENAHIKEHARKSLLRLQVAMDALKQIRDASHKSGRAKRIADSAIDFIEHALG